ncbi:MAG TPA: energy transducer TonB [Candidatus Eremiobacteraceae bacterium]|nr:energy transducer TonB [Candidatus Eremiobacteraceae bacterium]
MTDADFLPGGRVTPDYPDLARDQNVQGDVTVRISVGADGSVLAAEVVTSSGSAALDRAALAAARASRFKPPTANGVPVQRDYLIVYTFTLDD